MSYTNVTDPNASKSWYQSRAVWGSVIAIGSGLAAGFGHALSPDVQASAADVLTTGGAAIGGLVALWGRLKASRPIG